MERFTREIILTAVLLCGAPTASATDTVRDEDQSKTVIYQDSTMAHPRSKVYQECFMVEGEAYESSPYHAMDVNTAHTLSHSIGHEMRACAAWHAAQKAAAYNAQLAKAQMCIASVLLDDPAPVLLAWDTWLRDAPNGAGYLVWASRRWDDSRIDAEMDVLQTTWNVSERAATEAVATVVETLIPVMMGAPHK